MRIRILVTRHTPFLFQREMALRAMRPREIPLVALRGNRLMAAHARVFRVAEFALRPVRVRVNPMPAFAPEIRVARRRILLMARIATLLRVAQVATRR